MALTGMLAEITPTRVSGVLYERRPEILDDVPAAEAAFEALVRGAAIEVVLLTGTDPAAGSVRDLAVEAITVQTASEIEYSAYPEQQIAGDVGRGYHLHQRYLELLTRLRGIIDAAGGQVPTDAAITRVSGRPRGRFPTIQPYPDPVRVTRPGL